jgi:F-type H+-transporting ATPase subunit a
MNILRPLLVLGVIVSAVWIGGHVAHHEQADAFQTLFMHLTPAPLEFEHGHELSVDVPAFLNVFTLDSEAHPTGKLMVTNLQVFQVAAVVLILLCFIGVPRHIKTGDGDAVSRLFAGWCKWIRDEMVYPVMGTDRGGKFMPFFLCIFFFILFMNLFGLVPGGATATASIFVTCALALITLVAMLVCGMVAQGPVKFWLSLVPHVPLVLWPLMFVIEVFGLLLKPFALMIRLFANMTGGHLIVLTCMGLIMFFADKGANAALGYGVALPAVGFGVFIMIIEIFVALLQAYVFTMLSILFVNVSVHPEH